MSLLYYQFVMFPQSPLRIGGGNTEVTDSDVLLDGRNFPFLPGSGIAGIVRDMFEESDQKKLFGFVDMGGNAQKSKIAFSDAILEQKCSRNDFTISSRDGVGIDEWGMAKGGEKYDFQIVETSKPFTCIVECDLTSPEEEKKVDKVLKKIVDEGMGVGAKTTRGFGKMKVEIRKKEFRLDSQDIEEWLDFNPFSKRAFADAQILTCEEKNDLSSKTEIRIHFVINGSVLVRVKEASEKPMEDGTNPDIVTLKNAKGNPVISGTSWAGAFRHHMNTICSEAGDIQQKEIDLLFGKSDSGSHVKSVFYFSETEISGGKPMTTMRNSIDRFTGAPTNAALFTTQVWNGGKGVLTISYDNEKVSKSQKQILAASIIDLYLGIMSIGGEASVGRGIVSIKSLKINGVEKIDKVANYDVNMLGENADE